jgi:hypothetical protein
MRFFNYITLFVAIVISACAAYYSIVGLTAIFAAAFWPIVIMGSALELGKLTGAVWLHLNWKHAQWWIRMYMVPAVAVLMLITSMGIFGFLSRAHIEQTAGAVNVTTQIEQLNLDVSIEQDKIDNNKKVMSQLDAAVDSLISGSATQGGQTKTSNAKQASKLAAEATKLRKSQEAQRSELQNQIQASADRIATINKEKLTLEQQVKKIEAEVGPIKYVAALVYGDNPDVNTLEKAVRWMIIILVVVFDPLAVVLILAATSGLQYSGQRKKEDPLPIPEIVAEPIVEEPKKKLAEIQIQETLLPESLSEPSEFPKKSSVTKRGSKKSKSL